VITAAQRRRRAAVLATPVAVPLSMTALFLALRRRLPAHRAHLAGFAVYWAAWCIAFPLWVLGPRKAVQVLRSGRRPDRLDLLLGAVPVLGAVGAELLPNRKLASGPVTAVALAAATVNSIGEELLWRGVFADQFPHDILRGALWPLAGFTLWHLAPQTVRPSPRGRLSFLAGAAAVGAAATVSARRSGGLRYVLLPHLLSDACGVRTARFWLTADEQAPQRGGRLDVEPGAGNS
jgi:membrane protease YdiL (CAAX protease family)